jgi:hypothetical protein
VDEVSEPRQQEFSDRVLQEMEEFFVESVRRANNLVTALGLSMNYSGEADLSASLGNLNARELDAFRAAGTAGLADKNFEKEPLRTHSITAVDPSVRAEPDVYDGAGDRDVARPSQALDHSSASNDDVSGCRCSLAESKMNASGDGAGKARLARVRKGLIEMVRQGIMTKAEAQASYLEELRICRNHSL